MDRRTQDVQACAQLGIARGYTKYPVTTATATKLLTTVSGRGGGVLIELGR
ncbi:hypothetical protein [Modestobacter marinus]|uniref:Uncharacterized protein n=1 Tax=Modestobacter marinus TaxID=477641 RepID=A0A846LFF8_9ACTN|nr:hypothetical protein [Modestobacter marinus]NIH66347.1 hypothetical protein [Modestobacter marinus]